MGGWLSQLFHGDKIGFFLIFCCKRRVIVMVSYLPNNELILLHKYWPYSLSERLPPCIVECMHTLWEALGWDTFQSAALVSTRIWSGVCPGSSGSRSRCALTGIHEPQGAVSQALTLLGGARFIAWCLRPPFLGKYWRDSRHFWSHRACLDYGLCVGPA